MIPTSHRRTRCFSSEAYSRSFFIGAYLHILLIKHLTLLLRSSTLLLPAHNKKDTYSGVFTVARQRPTLAGGSLQLPSAQKSLTTVFGMGTGVTSLPLSPDSTSDKLRISSSSSCLSVGHVRLGTLPSSSTPVLELLTSLRSSFLTSDKRRISSSCS
jgi:hypothetical protein